MKNAVILIFILTLFSCAETQENETEVIENHSEIVQEVMDPHEMLNPEPEEFDLHLIKVRFKENGDTTVEGQIKELNGERIWTDGHYSHMPMYDEFCSPWLIDTLKHGVYETFDSLMCEVGGNSAYDKYVMEQTGKNSYKIIHYMAWFEKYEDGSDDPVSDYTPDYFVGHTITAELTPDYFKVHTVWEDGELYSDFVEKYDEQGNLTFQEADYGESGVRIWFIRP